MDNELYSATTLNKKETRTCVSKCMENIIAKCSLLPENKQSDCFTENIKNDKTVQNCSRDCIQKHTNQNNDQVETAKCAKWTNDYPIVAPSDCVIKDFEIALLENENTLTIKNLITFIDKLNSCKYLDNTTIALFIETVGNLNSIFNALLEKNTNEHEICDFVNDTKLYKKIQFVADYLSAVNMVCIIGTVDNDTFSKLMLYYSESDTMAKIITIIQLVKKYIHELGKLYITMESTFSVAQKVCTVRTDVMESLKNYNIKLVQIFLNTQEDANTTDVLYSVNNVCIVIVVILFIILILKN